MNKDYTRAKKMADDILNMVLNKSPNAARVTDTEPPVVEVYGITDEVIRITVDIE